MAVKKVKLPNNTTLDINDARVVSDGITYIGEDIDSATYEAPSTGSVVTWGTESSNHTVPLIVDGVSKTVALNGYSSGGGGGGTGEENVIEVVKINGTALTPDANKAVDITVPTISTNITTDATSDTKTASPKAVKTYVDGIVGDIETLLAAI